MIRQTPDNIPNIDLPGSNPWLAVIGWAAFLACSWTWCIGMFLPVLLLRDFGLAGYIAFAVPNIVGAAAMGWILATRESALQLVRRHIIFASAFSVVTIAFHVFFLVWFTSGMWLLPRPWAVSGILLVILMTLIVASLRTAWQCMLAALILMATAGTAAVLWWLGDAANVVPQEVFEGFQPERLPPAHVAGFLVVSIFGFALCPYLDLTFNRARSALPRWPARWAFTIGFGAMFFSMILLTLAYSGYFLGRPGPWRQFLALHIFVQSAFTMGVHLRALNSSITPLPFRRGCLIPAALAALLVLIVSLFLIPRFEPMTELHQMQERGLGAGETMYRLFMGFYGLAFPAYVWLCVIPSRTGVRGPSRSHMRVWAFAVGIAGPMFWMGFIERQTLWIVPALVVVLAARFFLPKSGDASSGGPLRSPFTSS